MREWYDVVMDQEVNPLKELHKPRRFQLMTILSFMWTTIFCFSFGVWLWFDELMLAHLAVLTGIAVTGLTFYRTRRNAESGRRAAEAPRLWRG